VTQRVTVTGPRRRRTRARPRTVGTDIDQQTRLGEVYMRSLLRAQLRLGVASAGIVLGLLAVLPLLFHLAPRVSEIVVLGIPLPWVVLGVAVYPAMVGAAWFYVRNAERVEREFTDLVNRK
jgi:hypothetical protein